MLRLLLLFALGLGAGALLRPGAGPRAASSAAPPEVPGPLPRAEARLEEAASRLGRVLAASTPPGLSRDLDHGRALADTPLDALLDLRLPGATAHHLRAASSWLHLLGAEPGGLEGALGDAGTYRRYCELVRDPCLAVLRRKDLVQTLVERSFVQGGEDLRVAEEALRFRNEVTQAFGPFFQGLLFGAGELPLPLQALGFHVVPASARFPARLPTPAEIARWPRRIPLDAAYRFDCAALAILHLLPRGSDGVPLHCDHLVDAGESLSALLALARESSGARKRWVLSGLGKLLDAAEAHCPELLERGLGSAPREIRAELARLPDAPEAPRPGWPQGPEAGPP